jgi:hypothetical protein
VPHLVGLGRCTARSHRFVLGAVAGTERAVRTLALVLPLAVFVLGLDIALSHCTLPLRFGSLPPAAQARIAKNPAALGTAGPSWQPLHLMGARQRS